jgi:hypothetical protein
MSVTRNALFARSEQSGLVKFRRLLPLAGATVLGLTVSSAELMCRAISFSRIEARRDISPYYFMLPNSAFNNFSLKDRRNQTHFMWEGGNAHPAKATFNSTIETTIMIDKSKLALSRLFEAAQRFYEWRMESAQMRLAPTRCLDAAPIASRRMP